VNLFLFDWTCQSTVVFALAAVARWVAKSASLRKMIWAMSFLVIFAQPFGMLLPASIWRATPALTSVPPPPLTTSENLANIWLSVAVFVLLGLAAAHAGLYRRVQNINPQPAFGGRARLSSKSWPQTPLTCGLLRPQIIMPKEASGWPREKVEAALIHEEAHIAGRDLTLQFLSHLICAALWFHPLAWYAASQFRIDSETVADEKVLRRGIKATTYASYLLQCASASDLRDRVALLAMARNVGISRRIHALVNGSPTPHLAAWQKFAMLGLSGLLLSATRTAFAQVELNHSADWIAGYRAALAHRSGVSPPQGPQMVDASTKRTVELAAARSR
jgi:hypothetical protein